MGLWSVVRWVRASGFAAACAGLAAVGHLAGGGSVGAPGLAAGFLLVLGPALTLARRERTIATILPAVAVCQVVLHVLLGRAAAAPAPAAPEAVGPHAHDGSPTLGMLLMHAVAVLVTSWWLESGEAALCGLVRRVAGWALRSLARLRPVPAHGPRRAAPVWRVPRPPQTGVLRHVMVRRGPPAGAVAHG